MSAIVSELILKTGAFNAGIKSAEKGLNTLKGGVMSMKGLLISAFAAITTSATALKIREQFDMGRQLRDLSAATGTSVKDLVVLQKAFSLSGVEADRVAPMIGRMRKVIADAAQGGASRDVFSKLHLSIRNLGKLNAADQMKAIGSAIMGIQNPTDRTATAMAIFGKQGQEMLKVFASGSLATAAEDVGKKAKILDENSALFADISKKLEKISKKTAAVWAPMAASIGPAIKPILDSLSKVDISWIGEQIGDAIALLITTFTSGEIGNLIADTLILGFQSACNFLMQSLTGIVFAVGQAFAEVIPNVVMLFEILTTAEFWKGLGDALLGIGQGFIALLLDGVALLLEKLKDVPGVGKKAQTTAAAVRTEAEQFRASGEVNRDKGGDLLSPVLEKVQLRMAELVLNLADAFEQGAATAPKFDTSASEKALEESFGKVVQMVDNNQAAADKFNAQNRPEATGAIPEIEAEQKRRFGAVFTQSLFKIGGGGRSVGGGKDPLLDENRRQTGLLSQIAKNTAPRGNAGKSGGSVAAFA